MRFIFIIFVGLFVADFRAFSEKKLVKKLTTAELTKIQNTMKKTKHLSVDYIQSFYNPFRKKTRKFSGDAKFSAPNKFLWSRHKPKESIYYDGSELVVYNQAEKVASRFSALGSKAKEISRLTKIVLDPNSFLKAYNVQSALLDKSSKTVSLELQPRQKNDLDHISVMLDLNKKYLRKVSLFYRDGKIMNYQFSNPSLRAIDKKVYNFNRPSGVKLVVFD